ncbi:unnamed protein product [Penicillium nalgiovense]|nr:unnamed protein product [Penicillium nalgiovense]
MKEKKFPCPRAEELNCNSKFASARNAKIHVDTVHNRVQWPCPLAEETGCNSVFATKSSAKTHAKTHADKREEFPCPRAEEFECTKTVLRKAEAKEHAESVHDEATWPCPHAEEFNCEGTFPSARIARRHGRQAHKDNPVEWPCPLAQEFHCEQTFSTKYHASSHAEKVHKTPAKLPRPLAEEKGCNSEFPGQQAANANAANVHGNDGPSSSQGESEGFPCPRAEELHCKKSFGSKSQARTHVESVHDGVEWPCPLAEEKNCTLVFSTKANATEHTKTHTNKRTRKAFPCPCAQEQKCRRRFSSPATARRHARRQHGKVPDDKETFIVAWPKTSPHIALRDVDGEIIPGWDKLPKPSFLDGRWACPDPGREARFTTIDGAKGHYLGSHMNACWPCRHAEALGCSRVFRSLSGAREHVYEHFRYGWICQKDRCLAHMQGKKMPRGSHSGHHRRHVRRGHFQRGECKPLKVLIAVSDGNIEAEDNYTEVQNSEDEEDGDGGDWESSSQDDHDDDHDDHDDDHDEVDNPDAQPGIILPDDITPSTELAASWLGGLLRSQDSLRKAARPETLAHLCLNCPGPGRVLDGQVLGTQVCPKSEVISLETGVLYRRTIGSREHIGLKTRCAPCNGRFMFDEFLRTNLLEANPDQTICCHKSCVGPLWENSKLCRKHFLEWTPELLGEDTAVINELRELVNRATSKRWHPQTDLMARTMGKRKSGEANVPASQIVNIDLETKIHSREILQVGIADSKGAAVLDCLTRYSEGVTAPSVSSSGPTTWRQRQYERKARNYSTVNGTLDAKGVVAKLRANGINKDTIFVAWATWPFDLRYLRLWLEDEKFEDVLPGDENVCMLMHEFRINLKNMLGTTCYRGKAFPISLPVPFVVFFGNTHDLAGRNHHALYDAQQTAMMTTLFEDL